MKRRRESWHVERRAPGFLGRDLSVFVAGALLGLLAGAWLRRDDGPEEEARPSSRGWDRLERAWEETLEGWASVREWRRAQRPVDLEALTRRLRELPGGEAVTAYSLGPGIVELVGNAENDERAAALLRAAEEHEGVRIVVNRIWTAGAGVPGASSVGGSDAIDDVQGAG